MQLLALVQRWGVTAQELLRGMALDEAALEAPGTRLSVEQLCMLSERARTLTKEPGIYSTVPNFVRAFRRWTGHPPAPTAKPNPARASPPAPRHRFIADASSC